MPALTMAAACRYALTGVGAAIAPGSQKWKGTSADLVIAPTRTSTTAAATASAAGPATSPGACSRMAEIRYVPAAAPRMISPTSMARPPAVVTISACSAERRADNLVRA